MYGIPVQYDYINSEVSTNSPNSIHAQNTQLGKFFSKYLLQKAMSVFEFKLEKNWEKNYFLYVLYCQGYISIINTDKFGIIPQGCGLQGYNVMYQPTHAVISNPLLRGIVNPQIGTQCVVVKLQPDYSSIMDLVGFYSDMMAICAETAGINLFNSKLSYVFTAGGKAQAESFKKLYDDISSGNPAVVQDKNLKNDDGSNNWELFDQNVGQNYIADKVMEDLRKWEIMFLSQIGINNANTDKKERLIKDEVNANNEETKTLCELWLEELQSGFSQSNELFGTNLHVDWRNKPSEIENVNNGTLPV